MNGLKAGAELRRELFPVDWIVSPECGLERCLLNFHVLRSAWLSAGVVLQTDYCLEPLTVAKDWRGLHAFKNSANLKANQEAQFSQVLYKVDAASCLVF